MGSAQRRLHDLRRITVGEDEAHVTRTLRPRDQRLSQRDVTCTASMPGTRAASSGRESRAASPSRGTGNSSSHRWAAPRVRVTQRHAEGVPYDELFQCDSIPEFQGRAAPSADRPSGQLDQPRALLVPPPARRGIGPSRRSNAVTAACAHSAIATCAASGSATRVT